MAEVLVAFDGVIADQSGAYRPRAVGRQREDGMWEGWIEFLPLDAGTGARTTTSTGDDVVRTGVETTQPEHAHLLYWATGLTEVFLEGALHRARQAVRVTPRADLQPATDAPAPRVVMAAEDRRPWPVLDPFSVARRSSGLLRQELGALHRRRLLDIIAAYDLNPGGVDLTWMTDAQLVHFIVTAVDVQMSAGVRHTTA